MHFIESFVIRKDRVRKVYRKSCPFLVSVSWYVNVALHCLAVLDMWGVCPLVKYFLTHKQVQLSLSCRMPDFLGDDQRKVKAESNEEEKITGILLNSA